MALLSAVLAEGGFESDSLATAMRDNLRRTPRLRLLSVYSPEGGVYYLLSLDRQLVGQSADGRAPWTGEPDYALRPLLHLRVSVPFNPGIRAEGLLPPGLVMDGVFLRLSREDLYPILRELFFVLL
ncbi:MAG: hypothetical protein JW820_06480, partial [Spirochaetales bacterium]|nr:hypothetical protein [Spirochaetales bacterium]